MKGKESWESTAKRKAKDSICYANVSKLLFLLCQLRKKGKKVSPESRKQILSLIENVEAEVQARPWKPGVEADQKNEKKDFQQ